MEVKFKGYSKTFNILPDNNGRLIIQETGRYMPDIDTEILTASSTPLRDVTDQELNEIMEELEHPFNAENDTFSLKRIRNAALNA